MSIVRGTLFDRPVLHCQGHSIGNRRVDRLALFDGCLERFVDTLWQSILHHPLTEDIGPKDLAGAGFAEVPGLAGRPVGIDRCDGTGSGGCHEGILVPSVEGHVAAAEMVRSRRPSLVTLAGPPASFNGVLLPRPAALTGQRWTDRLARRPDGPPSGGRSRRPRPGPRHRQRPPPWRCSRPRVGPLSAPRRLDRPRPR